MTKISKTR